MSAKILLVDDTLTVLMAEKMMLSGEGFELETAKNGLEALEKISTFSPVVVLLDIMMPKLDGIETCRRIKSDPDSSSTRVIMVTTKGEIEKVNEAREAGCDGYLTKPLNKVDLLNTIRKFI